MAQSTMVKTQNTVATRARMNRPKWIAVVQTAVGVNLNNLGTVAEFRAACEGLNGGQGVYVPADTQGGTQASAQISAAVTAATTPLNSQIASLNIQVSDLTTEVSTLTAQKAQLELDLEQAENERDALLNRPLNVTLAAGCSPRAARTARALASSVPPMQKPSAFTLSKKVGY